MNLAQIKIAALKKRLEKISQLDASLQFTEKEIEQRRRQFSQNYLVLPPLLPNAITQRPETQFKSKEKPEKQRTGNTYGLNTDFYRKTIFPDTNPEVINNPPLQKPLITLKPVEQVSSPQSSVENINPPQQNNILQKTKSTPQLASKQQSKPQSGLMFTQHNMKDNKPKIQINGDICDKGIGKKQTKQTTTGLFGVAFQGKSGQNIFQLKKGPIFNKNQSLIVSAPPLWVNNTQAQNKPQTLFRNNTQELSKVIAQQKQEEIKDSTPVVQIEDKKVAETIKQQPNQLPLQEDKQQNQPPNKIEKPQPKNQTKLVQQNKESPKKPKIYSPIMMPKNQEPQVPKLKEQIKKDVQKESNKTQMLGPKGKTVQVLPFFGNSAKPVFSSGQPKKLDNSSKPPAQIGIPLNPPFLGSNSLSNQPPSSLFTNIQTNKPPANLFTASQGNQPTPNLFANPNLQTNSSPFNNTNAPSLFGNPLAKASGNEFTQSFLKNAATGGIFSGQSNSLFNQSGGNMFSNPSSNSLFSGQPSNSLFSVGQNTSALFSAANQEDEEQSGEGDDQPLQAEENFNPQLSTGKYDYIQTKILFKEPINKFRKGKGQMLENITVSLQQFQEKPDVFLFVRLANKVIGFTGKIVLKTTQIRILNNSTRNMEISKILECGDNLSKPELCLLRLQFKDQQSGAKFKAQFQKILKTSS